MHKFKLFFRIIVVIIMIIVVALAAFFIILILRGPGNVEKPENCDELVDEEDVQNSQNCVEKLKKQPGLARARIEKMLATVTDNPKEPANCAAAALGLPEALGNESEDKDNVIRNCLRSLVKTLVLSGNPLGSLWCLGFPHAAVEKLLNECYCMVVPCGASNNTSTESATDTTTISTIKPATASQTKSSTDSRTKPANGSKTKPANDSRTKSATDLRTKPMNDSGTNPVNDSKTKSAINYSRTKSIIDFRTKSATDSPTISGNDYVTKLATTSTANAINKKT